MSTSTTHLFLQNMVCYLTCFPKSQQCCCCQTNFRNTQLTFITSSIDVTLRFTAAAALLTCKICLHLSGNSWIHPSPRLEVAVAAHKIFFVESIRNPCWLDWATSWIRWQSLRSDVYWPVYSLVHCHSFAKARRSHCHLWFPSGLDS